MILLSPNREGDLSWIYSKVQSTREDACVFVSVIRYVDMPCLVRGVDLGYANKLRVLNVNTEGKVTLQSASLQVDLVDPSIIF